MTEQTETEIWKDIPGHPGYQASNLGQIRKIPRTVTYTWRGIQCTRHFPGTKILKQCDNDGYNICSLGHTHRLVAQAWCPNDDPEHKICVNHLDENRKNNRPENLEWVTYSENINYGTRNERVSETLKEYHFRKNLMKELNSQLDKMNLIYPGFKQKALLFLE